ncbi:MAG TPA: vanadium-dependent haloperoxidase [Chthoniobacterales bacterium]|nr:vanadium-dependent haloperoxidase [Chthoniobacterales bacterium]
MSVARADSFRDAFGALYSRDIPGGHRIVARQPSATDSLHRWNVISINASGLDHTPVAPGDPRIFGQQLGPARASRAVAIVHIAMADVVSAIHGKFQSYTGVTSYHNPISEEAAISQAAHDTLVALFSSQAASFDTLLAADLAENRDNRQKQANGRALGQQIAARILTMRTEDGSQIPEPQIGTEFIPSNLAGHWRQDPISLIPLALGAHWGECVPFVLQAANQFRTPPPPATTSTAYTTAYNEVRNFGGDGIHTPTQRTPEQTFLGTFWAYDGTPSLCAPPRLYNQIVVQIADQKRLKTEDLARLLALMNVAMADSGMASWESKFYWDFWRPIGGIRESDPGTGPTGTGDGNPATVGDPTFMPLGAPASNLTGPNFTPPFPSYPSGHATFGGAIFQVMRRFFGTDNIGFTFVSDEFNGVTLDNAGHVRPYMPRYFTKLSQAEEENGQSRIYLGIHWSFDKTEGIKQGQKVADYVFDHSFKPTHGNH